MSKRQPVLKQGGKAVLDYSAPPASAAAALPAAPVAGMMQPLPPIAQIMAEIIDNKDTLETINFSGTSLTQTDLMQLLPALMHASNLKSLFINGTNCTHDPNIWSLLHAIQANAIGVNNFDSTVEHVVQTTQVVKTLDYSRPTTIDIRDGCMPSVTYTSSPMVFDAAKITFDMISNADNVETVDFSGSWIEPQMLKECSLGLQKLSNLKTLNLSKNSATLDANTLAILEPLLPYWPRLEVLDFSFNDRLFAMDEVCTDEAQPIPRQELSDVICSFAEALKSNCKSLRELNISGSNISASIIPCMLLPLSGMPTLSAIHLSHSAFGDTMGAISVCQFAHGNCGVQLINLDHCSLSPRNIKPLVSFIKSHTNIPFNLDGNFIDWSSKDDSMSPRALIAEAQPLLDIAKERAEGVKIYIEGIFNMCFRSFGKDGGRMILEYTPELCVMPRLMIYKALPAIMPPEDTSCSSTSASPLTPDVLVNDVDIAGEGSAQSLDSASL